MTEIAVIGAGVAGLGATYALRDADAEVTVFERRETVGGRAATRRREGCVYDVGANYLKGEAHRASENQTETKDSRDRVTDLLSGELDEELVDTEGPVWTFDEDGTISEGRDDDAPKWTGREGLAALADRLRDASDATVRTGTEVVSLARKGSADGSREDDEWQLQVRGGTETADAVVLTPPAPVTAYLLDRSEWGDQLCSDLRDAAAAVPYRTLLSVALHYPYRADLPYYALVNDDKAHDLGWVAREECKLGHVPEGESLLIVQPSPEWSRDRYDDPDDEIGIAVADRTAELLGDPDRYQFDWADVARWRDALPDAGADREVLARGADHDLFFAGDWVVGEARLHAALRNGLETGDRICDAL
jgi:predicted NAD/FAD-dependent oxidoreductase